ncbi:MAG TPA: serine/threonine protein kinase [bacterium]|nr:serine/threonine protein kinase [bacterium]
MDINVEDILREVGRTIFRRGVAYLQEGRVSLTEVGVDHFEADVAGTAIYHVRVEEDEDGVWGDCDCPFPLTCKHIVAAMLAARNRYLSAPLPPEPETKPPSWESYFYGLVTDAVASDSPVPAETWRVVYLFEFHPSFWILRPGKAYLKQDGSFGRFAGLTAVDTADPSLVFSPGDPFLVPFLARKEFPKNPRHVFPPDPPAHKAYGGQTGDLFSHLKESVLLVKQPDRKTVPIAFSDRPAEIVYEMTDGGDAWRIRASLLLPDGPRPLDGRVRILTQNPVWILSGNLLYRIQNTPWAGLALSFVSGDPPPVIPKDEFGRFVAEIYPALAEREPIPLPAAIPVRETRALSSRKLRLSETPRHLEIRLILGYAGMDVDFTDPRSRFYRMENGHVLQIGRDREAEAEILRVLSETGLRLSADGTFRIGAGRALEWLFDHLPALERDGFEILDRDTLRQYRIRTGEPNIRMRVSSRIDWFDLDVEIDVEGVRLPLAALRKAIRGRSRIVHLADGSLARLPEAWFDRFATFFHFTQADGQVSRVSRFHATLIDSLFAGASLRETDAGFEDALDRLRGFAGIRKRKVPKRFRGTLRPYQKAGLEWMLFLKEFRFGGCLADDMGLGKTVQALALLQKEKEGGSRNPSLIVCPTSIVFNWQEEIRRFTPDLRTGVHAGLTRKLAALLGENPDIILTTYGILLRDIAELKDISFHYVILDESQKIKNPDSQTAKAARLLNANHRLVLTGTPVENNTVELWSQFAFLNPGLLGSLNQFRILFTTPIEKHQQAGPAVLLRSLIHPFILRRTKENVARELPPKFEQAVLCPMNPRQEAEYIRWRDYYRGMLLEQIDARGIDRTRMHVLQGLVKLRQIACHPKLIDPAHDEDSGKFESLREFIAEITAEGHKILIFSQFVRMLRLIRTWCDDSGIAFAYLDGGTRNREEVVRRFQEDAEIPLFLISLRAGGAGLNLTAADYVIHVDPWWNPAVEAQATDRAHRIGQDKSVFVYRFITRDSVEEKMLELQRRKKNLVDNLIRADRAFFKSLTREDVQNLFS